MGSVIIVEVIQSRSFHLPPVQDVVIRNQHGKDWAKESGVNLNKQIQSCRGAVVGQDPRTGTYSQDSHQDHGRPVLHLKCVHKRIGRGHHVAGQVGGHLGKKDESKGCHQQNLVVYHL